MNPRLPVLRIVGFGFLVVMLSTVIFPLFIILITSLKALDEVHITPPTWWPAEPQFENYIKMFGELDLVRALLNTVLVATCTGILTVTAALPAGYALARFNFPGRRVFLFAVLGGLTFSPVVIIVSMYALLNSVGLINTYPALIIPDAAFALPFSIWLCLAYMRSIPEDLDDAALVDGASRFAILVRVIIPLAAPGVATVFIFTFIQAWNEFLLANTYMLTDAMKPLSVTLYIWVGYRGIQWNFMTAAILFAVLPAIVMFLVVQRWLVRGLASGAVK